MVKKTYQNNNEIFGDITDRVISVLPLAKNKIIDLGSDKPPQFARFLAGKFKDSEITHFKDTKTIGKIKIDYKDENLGYAFKARKLKESFFDVATTFFTLHEFPNEEPGYERTGQLKILHKTLKPEGKIVVIDYDLQWVKEKGISKEDFIKEIFTENNEKKAIIEEDRCVETHTSYGLEDCVRDCSNIGFGKIFLGTYNIETSWG